MTYSGLFSISEENPNSVRYERSETWEVHHTGSAVGANNALIHIGTGSFQLIYPLNLRLALAFRDIESLQEGWDSYDASKPTAQNVELAKKVCRYFTEKLQPEIAPFPDGGIYLMWQTTDRKIQLIINDSYKNNHKLKMQWNDLDLKLEDDSLSTEQVVKFIIDSLT